MDKEGELHELRDLEFSLRWHKYDSLQLRALNSLREEVKKRIAQLAYK